MAPTSTHQEFAERGYELLQTLGEGEFGKVKLTTHLASGSKMAVKLFQRARLDNAEKKSKLAREISILRSVVHASVVRLIEVVETAGYIGLVLEYASGGELFDYILGQRYLRDKEATRLFAQLIDGVRFLHLKNIVHRDLKLENLLLSSSRNLVIIDFGFANKFPTTNVDTAKTSKHRPDSHYLMATSCGSPCYAAPELVIADGYIGTAADVWSCGVILFAMLAGYLPFDDDPVNPVGDNITLLYKYILSEPTPLNFPPYMSKGAKHLLKKMLVPDPEKRATLQEIMDHPWLNEHRHLFQINYDLPPPVPIKDNNLSLKRTPPSIRRSITASSATPITYQKQSLTTTLPSEYTSAQTVTPQRDDKVENHISTSGETSKVTITTRPPALPPRSISYTAATSYSHTIPRNQKQRESSNQECQEHDIASDSYFLNQHLLNESPTEISQIPLGYRTLPNRSSSFASTQPPLPIRSQSMHAVPVAPAVEEMAQQSTKSTTEKSLSFGKSFSTMLGGNRQKKDIFDLVNLGRMKEKLMKSKETTVINSGPTSEQKLHQGLSQHNDEFFTTKDDTIRVRRKKFTKPMILNVLTRGRREDNIDSIQTKEVTNSENTSLDSVKRFDNDQNLALSFDTQPFSTSIEEVFKSSRSRSRTWSIGRSPIQAISPRPNKSDFPFIPLPSPDRTAYEPSNAKTDRDNMLQQYTKKYRSIADVLLRRRPHDIPAPLSPNLLNDLIPAVYDGPIDTNFLTSRSPELVLYDMRKIFEDLGVTVVSHKGDPQHGIPGHGKGRFQLACRVRISKHGDITMDQLNAELDALSSAPPKPVLRLTNELSISRLGQFIPETVLSECMHSPRSKLAPSPSASSTTFTTTDDIALSNSYTSLYTQENITAPHFPGIHSANNRDKTRDENHLLPKTISTGLSNQALLNNLTTNLSVHTDSDTPAPIRHTRSYEHLISTSSGAVGKEINKDLLVDDTLPSARYPSYYSSKPTAMRINPHDSTIPAINVIDNGNTSSPVSSGRVNFTKQNATTPFNQRKPILRKIKSIALGSSELSFIVELCSLGSTNGVYVLIFKRIKGNAVSYGKIKQLGLAKIKRNDTINVLRVV